MDIFFVTLIAGMATGFALELLTSIFSKLVSAKILRIVFTLPISYTAAYFLGVGFPSIYVVAVAASFFTLIVLRWLDKPVTIQTIRR